MMRTFPSRRDCLRSTACGFGSVALSALLQESSRGAPQTGGSAQVPMFPARAKRVIFLFMQGGPSHVDSFDYKPELLRRDGQEIDFVGVRFDTFGKQTKRRLMKPLWDFKQYGQTGKWVSSLFPHLGQEVDDLCFLHGMHTEGVAHGPSTLFLHTGATNLVRPSMGSWISYGLGTENENLPAFVSIGPSASKGGPRNYSNAFLPAVHQGTVVGRAGQPARDATIEHLRHPSWSAQELEAYYLRMRQLNSLQKTRFQKDDELDAVVESYELAFRMQQYAPELLNLDHETSAMLESYGINEKATEDYGRRCLLARKLAEAGVRYIQVNYSDESTTPRWDQHSNMPQHATHALATDKPVAGLIRDLRVRGLLEDTLVIWGGEFGRTPFSQGKNGRDHNPRGFTMFLAGGGVRSGFSFGVTDEIGHRAVDQKIHMHDLHATILHLLGIDHTRLTYRYAGRDFRLTDVHGQVAHEVFG